MTDTLLPLTSDQLAELEFSNSLKIVRYIELEDDTKYALALIKLSPAVTQGDYPALKSAIEAISGIQEITLVVDHQTRASIPANTLQEVELRFDMRLKDVPPP